jgi:hypothetical protein
MAITPEGSSVESTGTAAAPSRQIILTGVQVGWAIVIDCWLEDDTQTETFSGGTISGTGNTLTNFGALLRSSEGTYHTACQKWGIASVVDANGGTLTIDVNTSASLVSRIRGRCYSGQDPAAFYIGPAYAAEINVDSSYNGGSGAFFFDLDPTTNADEMIAGPIVHPPSSPVPTLTSPSGATWASDAVTQLNFPLQSWRGQVPAASTPGQIRVDGAVTNYGFLTVNFGRFKAAAGGSAFVQPRARMVRQAANRAATY